MAASARLGHRDQSPSRSGGGDLRGLLVRDGELYVVNAARSRVNVYNAATGTRVRGWGGYGTATASFVDGGRGITADGSGNIWVADMPGFRTQKFTPAGHSSCCAATEPAGPPPVGGYAMPESVAAFKDGTVAGVDTFNWRVNVHTADGTPAAAPSGRATSSTTRAGWPRDRSEQTLVVGNTDAGQVDKYTLTGQTAVAGRAASSRGAVAVDQVDGTIYAAEFPRTGSGCVDSERHAGRDDLRRPVEPALHRGRPGGPSVWVSNQRQRPDRRTSPRRGSCSARSRAAPGQAAGIEVNADTIFLADKGANLIRMYSKAGTPTGTFGGSGTALGRFRSPAGWTSWGTGSTSWRCGGERIQELRVVVS